ncbi:sensor histidine kinase [Microbacterium hominis]|uniref:histidine kinase n=1 Tax=Microbacterium hominis TaxID=162426 RepID=A0A7D4U950_9MICO|nr:HAMP domain-containing sensor histidine kinase [Microbacterium hominis]QKJ20466.1 HAMP domain-containing histidine kinase [Microbacterium hominis]
MNGRDDLAASDRARVQRSALRVGLWVGLASAGVVATVTSVTVAVMLASSQTDRRPPRFGGDDGAGFPEGGPGARRVVDLDDILPIALVLGVLGVIALGFIAWYAARRASAPLAQALEVQRAFVADASHELRTPLTTLTSRIQLAQHRAARGGDVGGVLGDLQRDAAVMDAVLTDLLVTAEAAGTQTGDDAAVTSVADATSDAVRVISPPAEDVGVVIDVDVAHAPPVAADRIGLGRALTALLDNAVRHAPRGSRVAVSAVAAGRSVEIRVADTGPGIAAADRERVFERFTRSTPPEPNTRRGFGLGLALVRDIATRFGGSVRVEENSPTGAVFVLTLPRRER